jgi:phosphoenolpyruvate carboxykinase (ATP)
MTTSSPVATRIHANLGPASLVERAIQNGEGHLTDRGAFTAVTIPHTGRSPKDKFVVEDAATSGAVWWDKNAKLSQAHFDLLHADVKAHLEGQELYQQDLFAGADPAYRLPVRFLSPNAWHMLFVRNMFIRPTHEELAGFTPGFSVLHAPEFQAEPARHGTATGTFIVLNFSKRTILIGGTRYAGELK